MAPMAGRRSQAMTGLEKSLARIIRFLAGHRLRYMVIGGIANLAWGLPRATVDIDITVWAPGREADLTGQLCSNFEALVPDPTAFVSETRVLPLRVEGFKVDVIFGQLPYEEQAIGRAKPVEMAGVSVQVATPEDLIIHKILSERPKDLEDVRGIVQARGKDLDRAYLDPLILGLARDLNRPDIRRRYLSLW